MRKVEVPTMCDTWAASDPCVTIRVRMCLLMQRGRANEDKCIHLFKKRLRFNSTVWFKH